MRYFRSITICMVALGVLFIVGCKGEQQGKADRPAVSASSEKILNEANWVRVDLFEEDSPVKGFIDENSYRPLDVLLAEFWHRIVTEDGEMISHLALDCGNQRYLVLTRLEYDAAGDLVSENDERTDWIAIAPDSNAEGLCLTLSPMGESVIPKRDIPLIRELLLKGLRKGGPIKH